MKKFLVAALVLVSAIVCHAADSVDSIYKYYEGTFEILQNGSMSLTYYSPDSKYGQIEEFGYFKVDDPTNKIKLDDHLTGNETVTIKDLEAGDKIAFYMKSKKGGDVLTIYSTNVTLEDSTTYFTEKDYGYTFGDTKWEKGRVLAFEANSTPSGQPLPGALTTMLIAGGCAAYLKRKKAARK